MVILSDAWHCRISASTIRSSVSYLRPGEIASLICNFYLSVPASLAHTLHVAGILTLNFLLDIKYEPRA